MSRIKYTILSCGYETEELNDGAVIAALLNIHANTHTPSTAAKSSERVEKLQRPTVSAAGSSEIWSCFITRWEEYRDGSKLAGTDVVTQLLECCNEDLRRDLTRTAGGSLANKPEQEILKAIRVLVVRGA